MKRPKQILAFCSLAVVGLSVACGGDDPTRVGRPPVVEGYLPGDRALTSFVGDTLSFRLDAFDPDGDRLTTTFVVDGAAVATSPGWDFVIADTGDAVVRATVSDGDHTSFIEWRVSRLKPVNLPPVVTAFEPVEPSPVMVTGNRLSFAVAASDPEARSLNYAFTVNDSLVATGPQFSFLAGSVGMKVVRAVVSDGENLASRQWNLKVTAVPDTIAPAEVVLVSYAPGTNPGEVDLEWIAVGRDGMLGRPSGYEVRTSPEPILSEQDWQRASDRPGVPDPALPGEAMRMTMGGLLPARETYLSVRAFDDFGNVSPLGAPVRVRTRGMRFGGRVIDALTREGIPNVVISLGLFEVLTEADGRYVMDDMGPVEGALAARDDGGEGTGMYFDYERYYFVRHEDVADFVLLPNRPMQSDNYTDFLQFYRAMTEIAGNPYGAEQRRWKLPINLYIRPFVNEGLDYRAVIARVAAEFDDILGTKVFNVVDARPSDGVETTYREGLAQDNYGVTEWTSDWYPRMALIQFRTVYTPATVEVLEVTARHELGHALGLGHSTDTLHIMVGGPAPSARVFSPDEVALIRCLYGIPRGWDTRKFQRQ